MSTKRKLTAKVVTPVARPQAKIGGRTRVDDSRTVVSGGAKTVGGGRKDVVEISSDSGSEDDEDSEEDKAEEAEDVDMADAQDTNEAADAEETAEPSFGDLVRVNASEPIDVAGAFDDPSQALAYPKGAQALQAPSGASLGTVLTQALKTNDVSLLESCLHTTDLNTIRATIQRLDSPLAGSLLQKLAERLHRRPGRAGSLMVWVQWTLITHGGYLATQPALIQKLADLNRVIDERARGLQSLLSLKGKLDLLEAQMQLRRSMQNQRRALEDEDDEEGVIYVEGQEDSSEGEDEELANGATDSESEESDAMPSGANGILEDSDNEEEDSDEGLIDDEAEETDASVDEDEVDHEDQDSVDEDDESDDGVPTPRAPPSKMQRTAGMFGRRR
jgi:U3 small nucleolar RNA-associated protein 5